VRSWAYLHRNLSGKYHVVNLGGDSSAFSNLKTADARSLEQYSDGVYIKLNVPRRVELVQTDRDVSDFFFPNGAFNGKRYELHSLITDDRAEGDASPYLQSASGLPQSETQGLGKLDVIGTAWGNLPSVPSGYVKRPRLEREIVDTLMNDRHPIVTLVGRGGIGKTSLALTTLHSVAATERYYVIIWFSARDIDLSPSGPKLVRPQVLTEKDIAREFANLLDLTGDRCQDKLLTNIMAENLRKSSIGGPILFVFDKFETVRSPVDFQTKLLSQAGFVILKLIIPSTLREWNRMKQTN
jgi:NB-ARC domain